MKLSMNQFNSWTSLLFFAAIGWTLLDSSWAMAQQPAPPLQPARDSQSQNGISRLLHRADVPGQARTDDETKRTRVVQSTPETTCLVPNHIRTQDSVRLAGGTQELVDQGHEFYDRQSNVPCPVNPLPLCRIERVQAAATHIAIPDRNKLKPNADEYIFDGNDRGQRTSVDGSWNVYGLDTEDTVGHFDTLDGQRIVTPSNRVAIYAPRFSSVRKVSGFFSANQNQELISQEERLQTVYSQTSDRMTANQQNLALNRHIGSRKASGLLDQTRGVVADNTTNLFAFRNAFEAYANIGLIQRGQYDVSQGPLLSQGIQSAVAWETDLGLRVHAQGVQPIIVRDVRVAQGLLSIESEDGSAILRVVKLADKMAAKTGEEVEFTLRFDNISSQKIGNVTLMDNLTRRLEYVEDSQECSVEANFVSKTNDDDSLMLRWEVTQPLEAGKGGVIRFRCRVR